MTDEQTPQAEYVTPRQAWNEGWDACMEYVNGPDWGTASQNPYPKYAPTPQTPDDVREAVAVAEATKRGYPLPDGEADDQDGWAFVEGYLAALSAIPKPRVSAEAVINAVSGSLGGSFSDALTDHIAEDVVARLRDAGIEVES